MCDEVRLVRYDLGLTPWGFRITGGRDFGTPLLIVKVVGGSIAALAGVQVGDLVRGINYIPTNDFTHLDALRAILESGDTLILNLLKGGDYEPEPPIPVIDIQSPEDKEVQEIAENEDLELSFVIHLDRSGRVSAVEEVPTPKSTPRTTPTSKRTTPSEKRRKSSSGGSSDNSGKTPPASGESEKKSKVSITVNEDGPINIQPPSYEDAAKSKSNGEKKKGSKKDNKQQQMSLHEEMKVETSMKKTTTEIKERTEEDFIIGVREEILAKAHKEKRELTEEEIAEMMAGEAEVIEAAKGKEVIGVNFQKFIPKCDFIKDSEVFKVLQEQQVVKEKSEEEQLEKDPLKRFSKFLNKPKVEKPIPKPKPIHPDPLPWQQRLNSPALDKKTKVAESNSAFVATDKKKEVKKETVEKQSEYKASIQQENKVEEVIESVSAVQESEEKLTMKIEKSFKNESIESVENTEVKENEEIKTLKAEEEEMELIQWKESKKLRDSDEIVGKRNSSEDGRRSKSKRVGFVGIQNKEDIEKQLSEIQKELLTLQRLPIEIQNHLLIVQQWLQDILALRSHSQTPVNDYDEIIEATEIFRYNPDGDEDVEESENKKVCKIKEDEEEKQRVDEGSMEIESFKEISSESVSSRVVEKTVQESSMTSENGEIISSTSCKETSYEESKLPEADKSEDVNKKKELPHGQEDVVICESNVKPALPLTPQIRPLILPGGRKWKQPKDAFTEDFIAETIVSQSEILIGTTIGVNFRKYIPPKFDTTNSAVYRLIHDIEERAKKGISERAEKVHATDEFYHPPIDKRHFYAARLSEKTHVDNLIPEPNKVPGHF